jgi:serine/threonine protein kinase
MKLVSPDSVSSLAMHKLDEDSETFTKLPTLHQEQHGSNVHKFDIQEFSSSTYVECASPSPLPSSNSPRFALLASETVKMPSAASTPHAVQVETSNPDEYISKQKKNCIETVGPQHFELLKFICEGAFGKVILVRNRFTKQLHAMKVLSKKLIKKKNSVQQMKSERDVLTKLSHPFVVALDYAFHTEQKLFLIMEFLAGGELFYHLRKRGHILEAEMQVYAAEMVLAIEFLHSKQIVHRDLKPENILLKGDGHVCITDFGLAKEIADGTARTLCGTSEYMAPEMISRTGYSYAVDWWALGVLCYEMLSSKLPFIAKSDKELFKKIMTERLACPPFLSANSNSLLKGLLEKDMYFLSQFFNYLF